MAPQKPTVWIGSSRDDLRSFPDQVRRVMGFAINDAQNGHEHPRAKALKGFGGRTVLEVVDDEDGDTYRAVYTFALLEWSMSFMPSKRSQRRESRRRNARLR